MESDAQEIIDTLRSCRTRDDIESVFETHEVYSLEKRIKLLKRATREINEYFSNANNISLEEYYEYELITFVDGAWRMFSHDK